MKFTSLFTLHHENHDVIECLIFLACLLYREELHKDCKSLRNLGGTGSIFSRGPFKATRGLDRKMY